MGEQCVICGTQSSKKVLTVRDWSISDQEFDIVQCEKCQFQWTAAVPSIDEIGPYYKSDDYISHSDKRSSITDHLYHFARKFMLNQKFKLINSLKPNGHGRLLDYGAGTGYFPGYVSQKGWIATGIEINESARSYAQKKFGIQMHAPEFLKVVESKSIDIVTLWHVLEHVHLLDTTVEELCRILDDNGHLVIAVPNRMSYDAQVYGDKWAAYDVPRHLWHFSPHDITQLAEKHNLKVVGYKGMPLDAIYVSILSEKYKSSRFGLLRGIMNGVLSNLKSLGKPKNYSSVIYILKKVNA